MEALRRAWNDPFRLALAMARDIAAAGPQTGRRASREATNAYYRAYQKKWRQRKRDAQILEKSK